jgi:glucosamine--fructose-6-phosphate aminotransferase (isomerizing)
MCGIAGVRKFGKTPITGEELVLLLCSLEHRGQHATGVALVNPDGIKVLKAPVPAWKFTKEDSFKEFLDENLTPDTSIALLHTRWATGGNPEINENNHPMFDGETAIIHNGMISNHAFLFTQGKYKQTCETDSDIIRAIVAEHGVEEKGIRELNKLAGSAAIACVSTKYPDKLLLARSGSPLVFGFSEDGDKLYWASEAQAILKAARVFKNVRGAWVQDTKTNISVGSMPDNTAWVFGEQELEHHGLFNTCTYYRQPDYSRGRENYHAKTKDWKREVRRRTEPIQGVKGQEGVRAATSDTKIAVIAAEAIKSAKVNPLKDAVVKCPGCGKGVVNLEGAPWRDLECPHCQSRLG